MTDVFVDAAYWIALLRSDDQWHGSALAAREQLGRVTLVTTEEVLTEVLTGFSRYGSALRTEAVGMVRDILESEDVRIIRQTHDSFMEGLSRYEQRSDKTYGLQDCIAMNVLEAESITEVLTTDHNFEQESFTILMKPGR